MNAPVQADAFGPAAGAALQPSTKAQLSRTCGCSKDEIALAIRDEGIAAVAGELYPVGLVWDAVVRRRERAKAVRYGLTDRCAQVLRDFDAGTLTCDPVMSGVAFGALLGWTDDKVWRMVKAGHVLRADGQLGIRANDSLARLLALGVPLDAPVPGSPQDKLREARALARRLNILLAQLGGVLGE